MKSVLNTSLTLNGKMVTAVPVAIMIGILQASNLKAAVAQNATMMNPLQLIPYFTM
jgi:hypothetical protein